MTEPRLINVTEEIVSGLVRFLLYGTDYQTFCHCKYCETEITADVLNKLPTYYVANDVARNNAFMQLKSPENIERINREIIVSIYAVGKNKNHA